MSHRTVTPEPKNDMPRQQGLLLRGSRWYSNFKVPLDLRETLGKEHIRESLGTSDYREAVRKIGYERARWNAAFENERKRLSPPVEGPKRKLTTVSQREAFEFACRFLARKEKRFGDWLEREGSSLSELEVEEILSTKELDRAVYGDSGRSLGVEADGGRELQKFLQAEGIECEPSSPAFKTLRPMFREAVIEHLGRSLDRLRGKPVEERNNAFRGVNGHSPALENSKVFTLDDLILRKEKVINDTNLSEKTRDALRLPARVLREVLGGSTPLASITREDMNRVFDLLRKAPQNAAQRYKGKTLLEAIEAADKAGDSRRLKPVTLRNIYIQITSLFNLGVEERMMTENPAGSRVLRQTFGGDRASKPRSQFTIGELNALFRSPLFVGCVDDVRGSLTPGSNKPRRGRFWVPLLALFHGFRCNEACQLYTEDVKTVHGVTILAIREEREDGTSCDKKLKTKQSKRDVPLHPELVRLGFPAFVEERRRDAADPHLFPELTAGHKGYFSDAFSKWFTRFVRLSVGEGCKATMHSFRHQFRDATRMARLPAETVALLAGWEDGDGPSNRQMMHYGRGPEFVRMLAQDLAKVRYSGLDLAHLYTTERSARRKARERSR